jgi:hypothetical protein
MRISRVLFILIFLLEPAAEARVFDFGSQWIATYISGDLGLAGSGDTAYANSSGANTEFSKKPAYNYSGEIGFYINIRNSLGLRLGYEVMRPQRQTRIEGTNASGTVLMNLNSTVTAYSPTVGLEFYFLKMPGYRIFVTSSLAMSTVSLDNEYIFTTAGTSAYSKANYTEKSGGSFISNKTAVGIEVLFTDNVTMSFDLGYRYLPVTKLKYKYDTNALTGNEVTDDLTHNHDGADRKVDLSGAYVGATFRFYLGL